MNFGFAMKLQTKDLRHFVKAMQVKCFSSIIHTWKDFYLFELICLNNDVWEAAYKQWNFA